MYLKCAICINAIFYLCGFERMYRYIYIYIHPIEYVYYVSVIMTFVAVTYGKYT